MVIRKEFYFIISDYKAFETLKILKNMGLLGFLSFLKHHSTN